jgi:hypothetical protein
MIEDLVGNIRRVVDGIAEEIAKRVAADIEGCDEDQVRSHVRQVLYEWFLGDFIPKNEGMTDDKPN